MTVSVNQPLPGARLIAGQTTTIGVVVTGTQSPAAVEFAVDGQTLATDSTFPFELSFTVPSGVISLTFGATATDAAGNQAAAVPVAVVVDPDPLTTITGRVVDAAGNPIQGAVVDRRSSLTLAVRLSHADLRLIRAL